MTKKTTYSYLDIAYATGIKPVTLRAWRKTGKLPAPDGTIGQSPYWAATRIEPWIDLHKGYTNTGVNGQRLRKPGAA